MAIRTYTNKSGKVSYIPVVNYRLNGQSKKKQGPACSSEREAKKLLKKLEYEVENEKRNYAEDTEYEQLSPQEKSKTTWEEAYHIFREYKVAQKIGFSQLDHIDTRYRKYIGPYFKNMCLEDTKKNDIIKFQAFLISVDQANYSNNRKGPLSATTVNKIMEVTKAIFVITNDIKDLNLKSPFVVKPVKEEEFKSGFYTKDEFKKFIRRIDEPRDKILFTLLFYTGVRIGEATALKYSDIINKDRCILIDKTRKRASRNDGCNTIGKPKTNSSVRNVYITEDLETMILEYREQLVTTEPLFTDDWYIFGKEKPISFQTVRRHNLKYAKAAGLPAIRIHDFRGSFTTNMFEHTTNIKLVSNALGHSNLATTTKHYLKAKESDKRELFERAAA